jgi:hypothetical protein
MPSSLHEAIAELFRNRPVLAAEVLGGFLHQDLPAFTAARLVAGDLPKLKPAERRADAVVMLYREQVAPLLGIIVEVQLKPVDQKRRSWPDYLTSLYSRYDCPATLLVVCPGRGTAAWAAGPIEIGHPGFVLRPLVLGPDLMPVVTDVAEAEAIPELAVLSGIAHGLNKAVRNAAFAAVAEVAARDTDLAALYAEVIVAELPKALRKTAEEELRARTIELATDFAKFHHAQGKAEGEAEGEAKGRAQAVLAVLAARRIEVGADLRAKIADCTDLDQLDQWLRRAATAESGAEVFK